MSWWWWIIPGIVGLLGVLMLIGGFMWLFRGSFFKGGRGVVGGGALLAVGLIAGLVGLNIQTYNRLTYERPVAIISARQIEPQKFELTMCQPGGQIETYNINGDQWRLEAYLLKWKPWANVLGLDSQYQLDRLSGRYIDAEQEMTAPRSVYALRPASDENQIFEPTEWGDLFEKGINIFSLPPELRQYAPAVDTTYGNGVFLRMRDGSVHRVWVTQDALIARVGDAADAENCAQGRMPEAPAPEPMPAEMRQPTE